MEGIDKRFRDLEFKKQQNAKCGGNKVKSRAGAAASEWIRSHIIMSLAPDNIKSKTHAPNAPRLFVSIAKSKTQPWALTSTPFAMQTWVGENWKESAPA